MVRGDHVFVVGKREGNQNIGLSMRLGHRFDITLGAHGKAIVAFMPETKREKILAKKKLYFYGDPLRLNIKRLKDDLEKCRQFGFAQDIGEITPGINAVSAPVFGLRKEIIGCVILIGTFPESMLEQYGPKTASMARQISYKLGADMGALSKEAGWITLKHAV